MNELSRRLVPDELWELVEPMLPRASVRPQGGGRAPTNARAVFTAIVFVLTSECGWRHLPASFGVTVPTAHRWFVRWHAEGVWLRLHQQALNELAGKNDIDWARAILDAAGRRAGGGG
ncbi:transposase [Haloactinomyces albus]|uniref:Transposase n=1 Tax=Haloactinomyces albus TaxID=1352928 RepID=A0AAE4CN40_9ACTN|nr:transposase [Haloactinomyces albus]MDR7303519.1 transposase [Haloactinomyces albus]